MVKLWVKLAGSSLGYSLVELVVVMIILAIIFGVALKSASVSSNTSRTEETKRELDLLAVAICGDPAKLSGGSRADYGYIGDIGALPSSLAALVNNPGGYLTWSGPYIVDEFSGSGNSEYLKDAWGISYSYAGGASLVSTGGGSTLSRQLAPSVASLLRNNLFVTITDKAQTPPGSIYKDSVRAVLAHPDGIGAVRIRTKFPNNNGWVQFDSIPIGLHQLTVVYSPNNDTIRRVVNFDPGVDRSVNVSLWRKVW